MRTKRLSASLVAIAETDIGTGTARSHFVCLAQRYHNSIRFIPQIGGQNLHKHDACLLITEVSLDRLSIVVLGVVEIHRVDLDRHGNRITPPIRFTEVVSIGIHDNPIPEGGRKPGLLPEPLSDELRYRHRPVGQVSQHPTCRTRVAITTGVKFTTQRIHSTAPVLNRLDDQVPYRFQFGESSAGIQHRPVQRRYRKALQDGWLR
ncbi:hypothetical protein D5S17_07505 [Pseudonocardiaceae bacterium YIM PH 21723]|nr:hypothetical protein D5S17_07505 [Pseudonocardiaceae bacterium YIM PH 21723]